MILTIVDTRSKYIDEQVMISSTTAATIVRLCQTFATHGLSLVSDNGTVFTSKEFQTFCRSNDIKNIRSAPYSQTSKGLAEHTVQTLTQ